MCVVTAVGAGETAIWDEGRCQPRRLTHPPCGSRVSARSLELVVAPDEDLVDELLDLVMLW